VKKLITDPPKSTREFSRFAHSYGYYNMIQSKVVKVLVGMLPKKVLETVIDVGCGNGAVYQTMNASGFQYKRFIALDASEAMLRRHPDDPAVEKVIMDFNRPVSLHLPRKSIVLSSSALQWSSDLDKTLSWLSGQGEEAYLAIFTSGTFKTLHETAGIDSPIHSAVALQQMIDKYYDAAYHIRHYALEFENVRDMFRYIKKSGVSGGKKQLSYKETKALMQRYPLNYLEFEVLFMQGRARI
jgi:malonyl-CoA O-methyltransferase